ncbi:MAG: helix-turn-helix transcriptional regulator [Pseudomonadota bacterium]
MAANVVWLKEPVISSTPGIDAHGIDAHTGVLQTCIGATTVPVAVVDADSVLICANAGGDALLQRRDGLEVRDRVLQLTAPNRRRRLVESVTNAAPPVSSDAPTSILVARRARTHLPLKLRLNPLRRPDSWNDAHWPTWTMVEFIDLAAGPRSDKQTLIAMFELTQREADVVQLIAAGLSPSETADALGISIDTARSHLKQAFQKMGVNRQADLVRLTILASG